MGVPEVKNPTLAGTATLLMNPNCPATSVVEDGYDSVIGALHVNVPKPRVVDPEPDTVSEVAVSAPVPVCPSVDIPVTPNVVEALIEVEVSAPVPTCPSDVMPVTPNVSLSRIDVVDSPPDMVAFPVEFNANDADAEPIVTPPEPFV